MNTLEKIPGVATATVGLSLGLFMVMVAGFVDGGFVKLMVMVAGFIAVVNL
jgi:hypothetical protein